MLPARRAAVADTLAVLAPRRWGDAEVRLRVGVPDGSVVDGVLLDCSEAGLSLRLPNAHARFVPAADICSIHQAVRRPFRRLAVVGAGILGVTTILVGLSQIPLLKARLVTEVGVLVYLGLGILGALLARTGLRDWLTAWVTLVDVGPGPAETPRHPPRREP